MDVVLGVAVTGRVARLAMIGSPASGGQLLDQYALDLSDDGMTELADTIVGTYRAVTESGNQVAATRLCVPDPSAADTLRQSVVSAGVQNVEVVDEAEAAAALARSEGADAALLLTDDDTASLTVVGEDGESTSMLASVPISAAGAAAACAAVLQQVPSAGRVMLVGQRLDLDSVAAELHSTTPVVVPPDAGYAIARGAAATAGDFTPAAAATQMAPAVEATQMAPVVEATQMAPAADATQMAPAKVDADGLVGPELAYSQEPGDEPWLDEMPVEPLGEFIPEQADEADYTTVIAPPPPRMLLMGSAMTFVLISFAVLAVTVAINIRPAADVSAQPVTATQADTVPGRYLPPVPHEPDPVALPVAVLTPPPAAPAAPKVRSGTGDQPVIQAPRINPAPPAAPPVVPAPPVAPAPVPLPIPVPVPPVIVVPPLNPWTPWTPPRVTPTTPTSPPVTTTAPPTTTSPPPTTTTTPPPTTTAPPTTTKPPTSTAPPTTTAPPTSTAPPTEPSVPPVEEPTYTPPVEEPTYTPPMQEPAPEAPATTLYPQAPLGGDSSSSGGESSSGGGSSGDTGSGDSAVTTVPALP